MNLDNVVLPSSNGRKLFFSIYKSSHVFHLMTYGRNTVVDIIALDNVFLPSLNGRKQGIYMYVPNHVFHPMTYGRNYEIDIHTGAR